MRSRQHGRPEQASRWPGRRSLTAVVALALAVVSAAALTGCASDDDLAEQYRSGSDQGYISGDGSVSEVAEADRKPAAEFSGTTDTGEQFDASKLRGGVSVVNFWYAACPPCRAEAEDLADLSKQFEPEGVQFLGVNTRDSADTARAFADSYGIDYPSLLDAQASDGGAQLAFVESGVPPRSVPTTLVLDAQGRVAARILGPLNRSVLETLITDTLHEAGASASRAQTSPSAASPSSRGGTA